MSMIPAAVTTMVLTYLMTPSKIWDHMNALTFIMHSLTIFPFVGLLFILAIDLKGGCRD